MSIVSAKLDGIKTRGIVNGPKHPVGAVQWGYDEVPVTSSPAQKPTVNQFRKIRVPSTNPPPVPKTNAPVKFKQEGADFQVPLVELYDGGKLKPAAPKVSRFTFEDLLGEMGSVTMEVPFDYAAGIKPGKPRGITFSDIAEPAGATFRS